MEKSPGQPFDISSFTQEREISDVANKFKEDIKKSEEPGSEGKNIHRSAQKPERNNKKIVKEINEYDKPVSKEEKGNFVNEFATKILNKAKEFGISKDELLELSKLSYLDPELTIPEQDEKEKRFQEELENKAKEKNVPVEKLKRLTDFDLESIEDIIPLEIKRGDFEFYKNDFNDHFVSIDSDDNSFFPAEFMKNHKRSISIASLAIYLSAFGTPVLKELSDQHIQIDSGGEKISPTDLAKNPELLKKVKESQDNYLKIGAEKEIPSEKITKIYDQVKNLPNKEIKYENFSEKIEESGKFLKYAELIKNGEKESLDNLANNLDQKGTDVILFGEYHGPSSNAINAVEILEKIQEKGHKKITKLGLEFLRFNGPKDIELTEKFNNKQISAEDFYSKGYYRSDIRPLLKFAQDNAIQIVGLEDEKNFGNPTDMNRFMEISHRVGDITKDKNENEITAIFIGQRHTTESNFGLDNPSVPDYKENRKDAKDKDYTIKEYLEKQGFKPAALNLDEWSEVAKTSDEYFGSGYNALESKNADSFGDYIMKNWGQYKLNQKGVFTVTHQDEKNVYSVINSSQAPDNPPSLTAFKTIKEKYPQFEEIINKKGVFISYDYGHVTVSYENDTIEAAQSDPQTGNIKEIFLPQGDYNKSSAEKMQNIDKLAYDEKLREVLTTYDPKLHSEEQAIKK